MAHVSRLSRGIKRQSPAMIIGRRHQSAPTEHYAERAIKQAAEEIAAGRYIADPQEDAQRVGDSLGIALGLGGGPVAMGQKLKFSEMVEGAAETRDLNQIGEHPRVVEALARMRQETESTNSGEAIEAAWAIHEIERARQAKNKWEGQERWEGEENEEMRQGRILSPIQFYSRLCEVIGHHRVMLSPNAHLMTPDAKSGRVPLYVRNPEYRGPAPDPHAPRREASKLRKEGQRVLTQAKRLRAAKQHAEADKKFNLAGDMAQAATKILMEASTTEQLWPTEFLRVGTLQWPLGTEWMIMNFDEYGVPTTAKFLGWRTALLTMVRTRTISEREANEAFPVGSGPAADWYLEQIQQMRNRGETVN